MPCASQTHTAGCKWVDFNYVNFWKRSCSNTKHFLDEILSMDNNKEICRRITSITECDPVSWRVGAAVQCFCADKSHFLLSKLSTCCHSLGWHKKLTLIKILGPLSTKAFLKSLTIKCYKMTEVSYANVHWWIWKHYIQHFPAMKPTNSLQYAGWPHYNRSQMWWFCVNGRRFGGCFKFDSLQKNDLFYGKRSWSLLMLVENIMDFFTSVSHLPCSCIRSLVQTAAPQLSWLWSEENSWSWPMLETLAAWCLSAVGPNHLLNCEIYKYIIVCRWLCCFSLQAYEQLVCRCTNLICWLY